MEHKRTLRKAISRIGLIIIVFNLAFLNAVAFAKKPDWVKKRPRSKIYFIGLGLAQKSRVNGEYIQKAKNNALSDLSSEITVNIASEFFTRAVEQYGMVEEEVKSEIRASTEASLEGFELVDTWEDKNEYWVYYRLRRDLYYQQKRAKIERAISRSLDLFDKGKVNEESKDISAALGFYLQSLAPIQSHIDEPLRTQYRGSEIYLLNEIFSSIQSVLGNIELIAKPEKQDAKIGLPLKRPLEVTAIFASETGETSSISRLPLRFAFVRGAGDLVEKIHSNRAGKATCRMSKITATDKIQIIKAELDWSGLLGQDGLPAVFQSSLNNLPLPSTKFILNVTGPTVYIEASESNLGRKVAIPYLEPVLKNALTEYGFTFTDAVSKADLMIEVKAGAKQGSEMYGMYTSYANLTISVVDLALGDEVYKNSLQDVKGIQLNYQRAGAKALENAAAKVKESILPDLIEHIRK